MIVAHMMRGVGHHGEAMKAAFECARRPSRVEQLRIRAPCRRRFVARVELGIVIPRDRLDEPFQLVELQQR